MASTCVRRFPLLLVFVSVFLTVSKSAHACSCGPLPTVLDSYDQSDVVVIVRAIAVEKVNKQIDPLDPNDYVHGVRSTTMVVEKVFKGNLKVRDEIVFGQGGGADCIWTFSEESVVSGSKPKALTRISMGMPASRQIRLVDSR